ncbi:unnamed protein product [Ceratitis capitata]|uniref:(Mediterranean fruit fly) hypothetical protein n=1 Tax=Ceratitis capitata TaxID=7213 RepID=A0A811U2Q5_CERCA|nr:unnamed protein product [Ceratitis capitata]
MEIQQNCQQIRLIEALQPNVIGTEQPCVFQPHLHSSLATSCPPPPPPMCVDMKTTLGHSEQLLLLLLLPLNEVGQSKEMLTRLYNNSSLAPPLNSTLLS